MRQGKLQPVFWIAMAHSPGRTDPRASPSSYL